MVTKKEKELDAVKAKIDALADEFSEKLKKRKNSTTALALRLNKLAQSEDESAITAELYSVFEQVFFGKTELVSNLLDDYNELVSEEEELTLDVFMNNVLDFLTAPNGATR